MSGMILFDPILCAISLSWIYLPLDSCNHDIIKER